MASDQSILEDALERYQTATNEWSEIRAQASIDMQVLTGGAWKALDPAGYQQRTDAKRPMIAPDELGQYINQVVNDVRANPRAMKFAPTGNGANDAGARFYENKFREIEYRSHSKLANTIAFENAVQRSYGFTRISTKYVHSQLFDVNRPPDLTFFDQDIWIEAFPNPDLVLPDPFAQLPDLSDQTHAFVLEWLPVLEFKRKYHGAKIVNFTDQNTTRAREWFSKDLKQVLTAEYWDKACIGTKKLLLLKPQQPGGQLVPVWEQDIKKQFKGDIPSELVENERDVDLYAVTQYITNGLEILETKKWAGKYIPIAGCLGKVFYLDNGDGAKRHLMSMTRLARDPFQLYMYLRSCQVELIGATPKFPYFYWEGSLSPQALKDLVESVYVPKAAIAVKRVVDGQEVGFPERNPYDGAALSQLELLAEAARRAIQAAMGISPLPTPIQRDNQKSGKALQRIEESGQRGSYHFRDHYEDMLRFEGVIVEDLLDKIIDTARDTGVREADGTAKIVSVNDPSKADSINTKGDYQGTVSTGPDFLSEREEASAFVDTLIASVAFQHLPPPLQLKILALAIRLKNVGALGDAMADLLDPKEDEQNPQQAVQQVKMLKGKLQEMMQAGQKMAEDLKTDKVKVDGQIQIKQMDIEFQKLKLATESEVKISVAELGAKVDRLSLFLDERARVGLQEHDSTEMAKDRVHDLNTAVMANKAAMAQSQQGHQQGLEAGQQGHEQALAQGDAASQAAMAQQQQAADLAPPPAGAGA